MGRFIHIIAVLNFLYCSNVCGGQTIGVDNAQDLAQMKKMILEQRLLNNMQTTFISLVNSRTAKLENNFKAMSKELDNMEGQDIVFQNLTLQLDKIEMITRSLKDRFGKIEKDLESIKGNMKCPKIEWKKFNSIYYFFSDEAATWDNAKAKCEAINSKTTLVTIHSQQINDFLIRNGNSNAYWTGGNDKSKENRWFWVENGNSLTYRNWRSGEPNNHGAGEDCLLLYTEQSPRSKHWNDAGCRNFHRYICQTYIKPTK